MHIVVWFGIRLNILKTATLDFGHFSNDADGDGDGGDGDGGGAGTTHPSWQVQREHHAQGSNIPFRYPSL